MMKHPPFCENTPTYEMIHKIYDEHNVLDRIISEKRVPLVQRMITVMLNISYL